MGRNYLLAIMAMLIVNVASWAQTGSIKGKVIDKTTREPIPFANVVAEMNGALVAGDQTDFDGNFHIKPLNPGEYDVKATIVGYGPKAITKVIVSIDKITFLDFDISKGVDIKEFTFEGYKVPLIDKGNPATQNTITQDEIKVAPTRDVKAIVSTTAGVGQQDDGKELHFRGARASNDANNPDRDSYIYIDGVKVRGSVNLPQSSIEQVTVITGGVPAQYGDATSGITALTTRGPSKKYFGGVEMVTSELFDDYGYNLAGFNVSGPLYTKKDKEGKKSGNPLAGFFVAGEYQHEKDPNPSAIGAWVVRDDILRSMEQTPFVLSPTGSGFVQRGDYLRTDSLVHVKANPNVASRSYRINGKFDIQAAKNVTLTFGGSYDYNRRHDRIDIYSINNYANNDQETYTTWRAYGKLTQKFSSSGTSEDKRASTLKNAFYSIQFDFTRFTRVDEDDSHQDSYFKYGYLGKFKTYREKTYKFTSDSSFTGFVLDSYRDTLVTYEPDLSANPILTNYTQQYLTYVPDPESITQIENEGGMVNGDNRIRLNIYSLWASPGRQFNRYLKEEDNQYRISASGSADLKNHSINVGFEYEQRIDRQFIISPSDLWTLMRQLANNNIKNFDTATGYHVAPDVIEYNYKYVQNQIDGQYVNGFFENFRKRVGLTNTDWVDLDSYDLSKFSLDLFTADELLNNGGNYVAYYGYDYLGNKTSDNPSLNDFFNDKKDGNFTRKIAPFQPIYTAGYIQDKFAFNDLIFNVGLRVDRFDANQKVLKDKYLLYPAHTVAEVPGSMNATVGHHPDNIGSNYVVYVNDYNSSSPVITGYRNGDDWYDAQGNQVADPAVITNTGNSSGNINPYLISPGDRLKKKIDPDAVFKDYEPQTTFMPRVAFSFPISDQALFFAHYDILAQRPPDRLRMSPIDYLFLESRSGSINNPDLKPEKTIDYELGFKQVLSKSSAITISAFYREMRDLIQVKQITYAFPKTYTTWDNIDFGTVKGISIAYDLRRSGNVRMTTSYTLQFAEGTGSDDNANANLVNTGQPNLREIKPLNFDQRHNLVTSFDFRFGGGADYNGPILFNKPILARTGLNVVFRANSGYPFSRQSNVTQAAAELIQERATLEGNINGSRLPWQFKIDARLDHDIEIKFGKAKDDGSRKSVYVNVYLQVQNLLDAKNVIAVYKATGNPNDDGYLTAATSQNNINTQVDPQSFRDLYAIKVNKQENYSLPRRIRLGVKLDF